MRFAIGWLCGGAVVALYMTCVPMRRIDSLAQHAIAQTRQCVGIATYWKCMYDKEPNCKIEEKP